MFSIISSASALITFPLVTRLYDTYTTYQASTPKKVGNLVRDLESKLPNLSGDERAELTDRIAAIKGSAKEKAVNTNLMRAGIQVTKSAGAMAGPIGLAVATYATHNAEEKFENYNSQVILKAKKIAGRRVGKRVKQKAETSAVKAATKAGISSAASGVIMTSSVVINTISWGKSLIFGS